VRLAGGPSSGLWRPSRLSVSPPRGPRPGSSVGAISVGTTAAWGHAGRGALAAPRSWIHKLAAMSVVTQVPRGARGAPWRCFPDRQADTSGRCWSGRHRPEPSPRVRRAGGCGADHSTAPGRAWRVGPLASRQPASVGSLGWSWWRVSLGTSRGTGGRRGGYCQSTQAMVVCSRLSWSPLVASAKKVSISSCDTPAWRRAAAVRPRILLSHHGLPRLPRHVQVHVAVHPLSSVAYTGCGAAIGDGAGNHPQVPTIRRRRGRWPATAAGGADKQLMSASDSARSAERRGAGR
jgi:hypothetical protein